MKTIIAGSRDCTSYLLLRYAIRMCPWKITRVVSGGARGVDTLGERWAHDHDLPLSVYPADWNTHGKSAGFIRNAEMAENAKALLALWDYKSIGTMHMINLARQNNLKTHIYDLRTEVWARTRKKSELHRRPPTKSLR